MSAFRAVARRAMVRGGDSPRNRVNSKPNGRVRYLTAVEREALIREANTTLRLYIVAALQTGARRSELIRLRWKDVDFKTRTVRFANTKNGDSRSVPMTDTLGDLIQGFARPLDPETPVFPEREPLVLTRGFTRLTRRLGLKDLTFHDLRHDAASTLAMAGVPLRTVAEILGHREADDNTLCPLEPAASSGNHQGARRTGGRQQGGSQRS